MHNKIWFTSVNTNRKANKSKEAIKYTKVVITGYNTWKTLRRILYFLLKEVFLYFSVLQNAFLCFFYLCSAFLLSHVSLQIWSSFFLNIILQCGHMDTTSPFFAKSVCRTLYLRKNLSIKITEFSLDHDCFSAVFQKISLHNIRTASAKPSNSWWPLLLS